MTRISPEKFVKLALSDLGFNVEKIPEQEFEQPDFIVEDSLDKYLIEVKSLQPNEDILFARDAKLECGEVYSEAYTLERQSSFTKKVSKGKNQISKHAYSEQAYRIIWFVVLGYNAEPRLLQIENGVFGKVYISDWSTENSPIKECFYFGESDFFRYREKIDGVILSNANDLGAKF